jgi:hypothetical protein
MGEYDMLIWHAVAIDNELMGAVERRFATMGNRSWSMALSPPLRSSDGVSRVSCVLWNGAIVDMDGGVRVELHDASALADDEWEVWIEVDGSRARRTSVMGERRPDNGSEMDAMEASRWIAQSEWVAIDWHDRRLASASPEMRVGGVLRLKVR